MSPCAAPACPTSSIADERVKITVARPVDLVSPAISAEPALRIADEGQEDALAGLMSSTVHYLDTTVFERPISRPIVPTVEPKKPSEPSLRSQLGHLAGHRATWVVLIGVAALATRLIGLSTAYDIFIDETSYTNIALSVAHGHGVTLYGLPFVLHPPAGFYLYGLTILGFGLHGGTESTLFALRQLDAVLGAATCVMTFLLVDRVAHRATAVVAALLIAVDPLVISFDSRVMLEAPAQLAVVTMFFCVASADLVKDSKFKRRNLLAVAGLAGGIALSTKETFGLVVLLSLFVLFAGGWIVTRRELFRVTLIALITYSVSIFADASHFGLKVWWNAKVIGMLRLVGAYQNSGFNAPSTHVSIFSRMTADARVFGVTYVLLVFGACCALGLLWRLEPWYRKRLLRGRPEATRRLDVHGLDARGDRLPRLRDRLRHHRGADVLHPVAPGGHQRLCLDRGAREISRRPPQRRSSSRSPPRSSSTWRCGRRSTTDTTTSTGDSSAGSPLTLLRPRSSRPPTAPRSSCCPEGSSASGARCRS